MMDSITAIDESSAVSFQLDQEEHTIIFDESATLFSITDELQNGTYTEIEFNHCAEVPIEKLCEAIPTVNPNLKSLIIQNTPWINDECIELFTAYCCKLYKIEFHGCLTEITRSGIESIGRNCISLLSLSLISTDDGDGSDKWKLDNRIFPALINNMNCKLRHFTLSGFESLTVDALEKFLSYFHKTLQSLDFSELSIINNDILQCIGNSCNRLFVLKLNQCKNLTDAGIQNLMCKQTNLEVLELNGCNLLTDIACDIIATNCPQLTILKVDQCELLTEKSLTILSLKCPKLSYLSMKGTNLNSIPCTLTHLKYLTYFNVDDCANIKFPSQDVISSGVNAIQETLQEFDVSQRLRLFLLGSSQSGKTSIMYALKCEQENTDGETFGIPTTMWYPDITS